MDALAAAQAEPLAALDRAGYRLTGPRRAVAELVRRRTGHFTAADLVEDAGKGRLDIGRATIFRTIDVLEAVGAIERIDLPSGDHAWIACEPEAHHHHVVCARCGRATDVDDAGLGPIVSRIASESGYLIAKHRLELFGLCPACQADDRAAATG
jgi:Fur family ferric uptake transcriptional regulator